MIDKLEQYLRILDLLRESTPVLAMPEFDAWLINKINILTDKIMLEDEVNMLDLNPLESVIETQSAFCTGHNCCISCWCDECDAERAKKYLSYSRS